MAEIGRQATIGEGPEASLWTAALREANISAVNPGVCCALGDLT